MDEWMDGQIKIVVGSIHEGRFEWIKLLVNNMTH